MASPFSCLMERGPCAAISKGPHLEMVHIPSAHVPEAGTAPTSTAAGTGKCSLALNQAEEEAGCWGTQAVSAHNPTSGSLSLLACGDGQEQGCYDVPEMLPILWTHGKC